MLIGGILYDHPRRTPLHCAASCNSIHLCKMLVESGAAIFATTISDIETAADKCEEMEEGYTQCSQFLYGRSIMKKNIFWSYKVSVIKADVNTHLR